MSISARYHITKRGTPGVCRAKTTCPLGGQHYPSKESAAAAVEAGAKYIPRPRAVRRSHAGGTSNTSANETYAVEALVAFSKKQTDAFDSAVTSILALPEEQKFLAYRGKSLQQVTSSLYSLYRTIASHSGVDAPTLDAPTGNHNGSDLIVVGTGESYELKFGAATDVNAGAGVVAEHLLGATASYLPSREDRKRWIASYLLSPEAQKAEHDAKLRKFVAEYSKQIGQDVPESGSRLLHAYFSGITNAQEALTATPGAMKRKITRLILKEDEAGKQLWLPGGRAPIDQAKPWKVANVEWTDKNRLVIRYTHASEWLAKFVYNYKNRYRSTGAAGQYVADPMQGLGTPSYNVWFHKP